MRNREVQINVRTTPQEKERFRQHAKSCGLSLSEYLRKLANGYEPKPLPQMEYQKLIPLLSTIYSEIKPHHLPNAEQQLIDAVILIQKELLMPEQGVLMGSPQSELCGEKEHPRSAKPFGIMPKATSGV